MIRTWVSRWLCNHDYQEATIDGFQFEDKNMLSFEWSSDGLVYNEYYELYAVKECSICSYRTVDASLWMQITYDVLDGSVVSIEPAVGDPMYEMEYVDEFTDYLRNNKVRTDE